MYEELQNLVSEILEADGAFAISEIKMTVKVAFENFMKEREAQLKERQAQQQQQQQSGDTN